jgi:cobyrinic acid a,c-diamide synthase
MSGSGKTTISLALMLALRKRGFKVQPFKVGPDFIDTTLHRQVCGVPSRNLDTWLLPSRLIPEILANSTRPHSIAVIEGVMGLYDGFGGARDTASTARIAKLLKTPIVLIVDTERMARSAAAVVLGFKKFDPKVKVAAVILNKVAGEKHAAMCRDAIEKIGIPVVGAIPYDQSVNMRERHLGLVPTPEQKLSGTLLSKLTETIENNCDVTRLIKIASKTSELPASSGRVHNPKARFALGVAYDEAFNFYYEDALDYLRTLGADIQFFSPINDQRLPEVSGLYIGGGFPELYGKQLEAGGIRDLIRRAAESGMPIYAECGGMMYLSQSLTTVQGGKHRMVGVLPGNTVMTGRFTLNYTEAHATRAHPFLKSGKRIRGQEFHYSTITDLPNDIRFAYKLSIGKGMRNGFDGIAEYSTLGSYMHTHLLGCPAFAKSFVESCYRFSRA